MEHTILVIEDDTSIRKNIVQMLAFEGYNVLGAVNGLEGTRIAIERRPDLIICDVNMPELDGFGVLKLVREHAETVDTPFIFLTARASRQDIRQGMTMGADDFITKPFSDSELLDAISARFEKIERTNRRSPVSNKEQIGNNHTDLQILVVKDSQIVLRFIEQAISTIAPEARIQSISTEADILRMLADNIFHIAVVDAGAADDLRSQAVEILRKDSRHSNIPIVLIVNSDNARERQFMKQHDIRWCCTRPINLDLLQTQVQSAVDSLHLEPSSVKKKAKLVYTVLEDESFLKRLTTILQHRFIIRNFRDWKELSADTESLIPQILIYDRGDVTHLTKKMCDNYRAMGVKLVHVGSAPAADDSSDGTITYVQSSTTSSEILRVFLRSVLLYTGSYEYNVADFLKENLLNVFVLLVGRHVQLGTIKHSQFDASDAQLSSEMSEFILSSISLSVSSADFSVTFSLRGAYQKMKYIISTMKGVDRNTDAMTEVLQSWDECMRSVCVQLESVLQNYGLLCTDIMCTSRISIDKLPEDFHWYIEKSLRLQDGALLHARFGLTNL